ncbi:MAG: hypothetical protein HY360_24310 [Verrucomicrobia bacterium]|nr:hypothetical protein [Verrucomicrobiota bacterium]
MIRLCRKNTEGIFQREEPARVLLPNLEELSQQASRKWWEQLREKLKEAEEALN